MRSETPIRKRLSNPAAVYAVLGVLFVALLLLSVSVGSTDVNVSNAPFTDALKVLLHRISGRPEPGEAMKTYSTLVVDLRLPRALTAAIVGGALAVAGCAMQGLLKNPLADGSILGISSGGAFGAVLFLALGPALPAVLAGMGVALVSIVFAFLSLLIVLALAWRIDRGLATDTIILLGVVFSMFAGSLTSLVITFAGSKVNGIVFWLMGSLSYSSYGEILWLLPVSTAGMLFLGAHAQELNAFALGEEQAGYLGVNTRSVKLQVMAASAVLVGASVAVGGVIGFVGLISPHIVRLFTGSNHRKLIPASALFGASFLMLADLASRTVLRPQELPIGIVTSLAGSLLFIYLFVSMRRKVA